MQKSSNLFPGHIVVFSFLLFLVTMYFTEKPTEVPSSRASEPSSWNPSFLTYSAASDDLLIASTCTTHSASGGFATASSMVFSTLQDVCTTLSSSTQPAAFSPTPVHKDPEYPVKLSSLNYKNIDVTSEEELPTDSMSAIEEDVYETLRTIRDPEYPSCTLGRLRVITPQGVCVSSSPSSSYSVIEVTFRPTVAHCSMAALIGLSIFMKLNREYDTKKYKIEVFVQDGSHEDVKNINKLCNDKERISAAMENPEIMSLVENAIQDYDD